MPSFFFSCWSCSMLMLLPPHTTTTTGPSRGASLPSPCSLLMMLLYTAARAAPQAGSTRIFSSSAGGGSNRRVQFHGRLLSSHSFSALEPVSLTHKALDSFHRLLVSDDFRKNHVLVHQFERLCRNPHQAQCGCYTAQSQTNVMTAR